MDVENLAFATADAVQAKAEELFAQLGFRIWFFPIYMPARGRKSRKKSMRPGMIWAMPNTRSKSPSAIFCLSAGDGRHCAQRCGKNR